MPQYILSLTKNPNDHIPCVLRATYCPVFEVMAKINVSVPSDVINRSKSINNRPNDSDLRSILKAQQC